MISIIIPSINDPYLQRTIDDVNEKSVSDVEVIAVVEGHSEPIYHAKVIDGYSGMRNKINAGVFASHADYIAKCDAHCMFDEGFDWKLLETIEDNWVVVPRRYNLDVKKWKRTDDEPIDYDMLVYKNGKFGGARGKGRAKRRKNIPIDETMTFQGSFYLMHRKWWGELGGLKVAGYGTFAQESTEIAMKTWSMGGKVMVNKNTWYAHKHRKFGRTHAGSRADAVAGNDYAVDYWMNQRADDLSRLQERFSL